MTIHFLDDVLYDENELKHQQDIDENELKHQQEIDKKEQKKEQKARKKEEKARKKAEKAEKKKLKKQAKQGIVGYNQEGDDINLSERENETVETINESQKAEENDAVLASASIGSVILIGGALLLIATSAIFYRKRQKHSH